MLKATCASAGKANTQSWHIGKLDSAACNGVLYSEMGKRAHTLGGKGAVELAALPLAAARCQTPFDWPASKAFKFELKQRLACLRPAPVKTSSPATSPPESVSEPVVPSLTPAEEEEDSNDEDVSPIFCAPFSRSTLGLGAV